MVATRQYPSSEAKIRRSADAKKSMESIEVVSGAMGIVDHLLWEMIDHFIYGYGVVWLNRRRLILGLPVVIISIHVNRSRVLCLRDICPANFVQ